MRIVHVMAWYMAGHDYQENHLPYQQSKLRHDVWIITSDRASPKYGIRYKYGVCMDKGVPIIRLKASLVSPWQVFLKGLSHQVEKLRPDIIHAHGIWTLPTLQLLCSPLLSQYKLFIDDHMDGYNFRFNLISRRIWMMFFRHFVIPLILRRVSKFISVNPFSYWHLKINLKILPNKIALLPLGVDTEVYYPDPISRQKIRSQLGIQDDEVLFFTAGTFDSTKGLETLIKAFSLVVSQYESTRLLLIGSGPKTYVNFLHQLVENLGISNKVIFQGWINNRDLPAYYNAGDVAIMPGKISTVKEAIAVGVPLIVTKEKASEYLIVNQNGFTFKKGDYQALSKIMARYIESPQIRIEHGQRSLALARDKISWGKIAEKSLTIYRMGG